MAAAPCVICSGRGPEARWIRVVDGAVDAVLVPNGTSMNSVLQVTRDGVQLPVPMPSVVSEKVSC